MIVAKSEGQYNGLQYDKENIRIFLLNCCYYSNKILMDCWAINIGHGWMVDPSRIWWGTNVVSGRYFKIDTLFMMCGIPRTL